jgi:regulatory protein
MAAKRWSGEGERSRASGGQPEKRPRAKQKAKTPLDLMQVALANLDRRDRTKAQLRKLLLQKAVAAREQETEGEGQSGPTAADEERVSEVLARLESSGVIDDGRFAEHFARGARNRGASAAKVKQKLGQRGIAKTGVDDALETLASEGLDDLAAAQQYAKRRRLRERYDLRDPKERQKALASLARQGFSMGTALRALGTNAEDESES